MVTDDIIEMINNLSLADKRVLSQQVHTTVKGIEAYTAFVYGAGEIGQEENTNEAETNESSTS